MGDDWEYASYLDAYQQETDCIRLDTDASTEFDRLWIITYTYGFFIISIFYVPFFLGGYYKRNRALSKSITDDYGNQEPEEQPDDDEREDPGEQPPQAIEDGGRDGDGAGAEEAGAEEAGAEEAGVKDGVGGEDGAEEAGAKGVDKALEMEPADAGAIKARRQGRANQNQDVTSSKSWAVRDFKPNIEEACRHLKETSPTDEDGKWRGIWSTSLSDIGEIGGVGLELYFRLLRDLGIAFSAMSVVTMPITVFSWYGNFVPDTGSTLAKTTVGNLGWIAKEGLAQEERWMIVGCQAQDIRQFTRDFGYLDFFSTMIFFFTVAVFYFRVIPALKEEVEEETLTVADFSVLIDYLPPKIEDQKSYQKDLEKHLEKRLEDAQRHMNKAWKRGKVEDLPDPVVHEVALVQDTRGNMGLMQQTLEYERQLVVARQKNPANPAASDGFHEPEADPLSEQGLVESSKVTSLKKAINKIDETLAKDLPDVEEREVVRAYAILSSPIWASEILMQYRFSVFRIFRCCQPRRLRFKEAAIRVKRPTEPSSLIPLNQDIPARERLCRRAVLLVLSLLATVVSFAIIASIHYAKGTDDEAAGSVLESPVCDSAAEYASKTSGVYRCDQVKAIQWDVADINTTDEINCYCLTQGYTHVLVDDELRNGVCYDWLIKAGAVLGINLASAGVIVVLNMLYRQLVLKFADALKPLTHASRERFKISRVFGSNFLNIAMVVVVVNARFEIFGVAVGYYDDTERGWYTSCGAVILSNMMMNSVTIPLINTLFTWLDSFLRCFYTRSVKHQADLLALYEYPEYDISEKVAALLVTVSVTMIFNAGMPLLTPCACLFCFLTYWSEKRILLQHSRKPPIYGASLSTEVVSMCLLVVPAHLILTIIMYSHKCTFPSQKLGGALGDLADQGLNDANDAAQNATSEAYSGFGERGTLESTWLHFVLLLVWFALLVVFIVLRLVGATFGEAIKCCIITCCPNRTARVQPQDFKRQGRKATKFQLNQVACWTVREPRLNRVMPPTSYRVDRSFEFMDLAPYMEAKEAKLRDMRRGILKEKPTKEMEEEVKEAPA